MPRKKKQELQEQIFYYIAKKAPEDLGAYQDLLAVCKELNDHDTNKRMRSILASHMGGSEYEEVWRKSLLYDAPIDLDAYCRYIELDRKNKFYAVRRKQLRPVIESLQNLESGDLEILGISMPPGVGKTTAAEYFLSWLAGLHPELGNLCMSHNTTFLRGVYDEFLRIFDPKGDYLWKDVFPDKNVVRKNALDMKIDIDKEDRFSTLQFSSIGSGNAGKVRAQGILYCDDLIEGAEEALSKARLDKKWRLYTDDAKQRKEGNCKELHIATRWSVHDIIGRLQLQNEFNPKARFIAIPALNDKGESNFNYRKNGFSTKFYLDMKDTMDDVSWKCLYMNQPVEREGLLYVQDELRRFYKPPEEPDAVIAVCDTANGGGDYCVMPVFYVVGDDHYMVDCVCNNGSQESRDAECIEMLLKWKVQQCQFESNNAGGRTADVVEAAVKEKGGRCYITKKWTQSNKQTKIIVNSPWIKTHCLFLDNSNIKRGSEYSQFMKQMCEYSQIGRNPHDDVPDALAMYALFSNTSIRAKAIVRERLF